MKYRVVSVELTMEIQPTQMKHNLFNLHNDQNYKESLFFVFNCVNWGNYVNCGSDISPNP